MKRTFFQAFIYAYKGANKIILCKIIDRSEWVWCAAVSLRLCHHMCDKRKEKNQEPVLGFVIFCKQQKMKYVRNLCNISRWITEQNRKCVHTHTQRLLYIFVLCEGEVWWQQQRLETYAKSIWQILFGEERRREKESYPWANGDLRTAREIRMKFFVIT